MAKPHKHFTWTKEKFQHKNYQSTISTSPGFIEWLRIAFVSRHEEIQVFSSNPKIQKQGGIGYCAVSIPYEAAGALNFPLDI